MNKEKVVKVMDFNPNPIFISSKNEPLSLDEIIKTKKITLVNFSYLSRKKVTKAKGWKGLFGLKEVLQEDRFSTVEDENGINCAFDYCDENNGAIVTLRFWKKDEFERIGKDYDEETLMKSYIMNLVRPYRFCFHVGNLRYVDWD